jgi:mRNA interferase RelE/StbE
MWDVRFIDEAEKEFSELDKEFQRQVISGIAKVSQNPLPFTEGGYGKPLGNKNNLNLTGFFKIKYRRSAIRVVYTIVREKQVMNIIVINKRDEDDCYTLANQRKTKYGDKLNKA